MSTARILALVFAASCSSKHASDPCAPVGGSGAAAIDGVHATVCFDAACLRLDRDGAPLGPGAAIPRAADPAPVITLDGTAAKACTAAGRCASVQLGAPATLATASASLRRLTAFEAAFLETFDLKTGQLQWRLPVTAATRGVVEARYAGETRVLIRTGAQWSVIDPSAGTVLPIGAPGAQVAVIDPPTVVAFAGHTLTLVDAAAMKVTGTFTAPGRVAQALPWFDRVFVVVDTPPGTAQIDPKTATFYAGPPLPMCQ